MRKLVIRRWHLQGLQPLLTWMSHCGADLIPKLLAWWKHFRLPRPHNEPLPEPGRQEPVALRWSPLHRDDTSCRVEEAQPPQPPVHLLAAVAVWHPPCHPRPPHPLVCHRVA